MKQPGNVMEVFKLLDKSNCKKCHEKTCLAFASAVFKGKKQISECPLISHEDMARFETPEGEAETPEADMEETVEKMRKVIRQIDFPSVADKIGATFHKSILSLKIMGKDFSIDTNGNIYTDIHVNSWVVVSVFNYIIHCKGVPVEGDWVPLRELPGGRDWNRFFEQQCEKPLKKLADTHPDLLEDLVNLFSGQRVSEIYQSDIAVMLFPLPLVPMLLCYWKPEDGMESCLNLFFDATAGHNIGIEGLYLLGTGITRMFEKLALQHGLSAIAQRSP